MLTDCANHCDWFMYHSRVACVWHESRWKKIVRAPSLQLSQAGNSYSLHAKLPHMTGCNDTPLTFFVFMVSVGLPISLNWRAATVLYGILWLLRKPWISSSRATSTTLMHSEKCIIT